MRIKEADDKRPQIDALSALLGRPDVAAATRQRIEQEIRNIRTAGAFPQRSTSIDAGPWLEVGVPRLSRLPVVLQVEDPCRDRVDRHQYERARDERGDAVENPVRRVWGVIPDILTMLFGNAARSDIKAASTPLAGALVA
jgi:hypothetical protein